MNATGRNILFDAYRSRVMQSKLALPLSQVNDLSVIRDANGKVVSIPEHATDFMRAVNEREEVRGLLRKAINGPWTDGDLEHARKLIGGTP